MSCKFLSEHLARQAKFQTLAFTFLDPSDVEVLRKNGTRVITVEGHFLNLDMSAGGGLAIHHAS
jgi:hypothetical protein